MNHLLRELAPISEAGWRSLADEATEQFGIHLAARKLVDFSGPHGWTHSATEIGRQRRLELGEGAGEGTRLRQRKVLPLAELQVPFTMPRAELEDAERGASNLDFDALDAAALQLARLENHALFHGWHEPGFVGMTAASGHSPVPLGAEPEAYPKTVARAVNVLRDAGIEGPYAFGIGPVDHAKIMETTEHGGYLLLDHLRRILGGGKVVRSPGIEGAVVLGAGDGNFCFDVGQDISIGYSWHDAENITLYFEESFTVHVMEPDAAVALTAE